MCGMARSLHDSAGSVKQGSAELLRDRPCVASHPALLCIDMHTLTLEGRGWRRHNPQRRMFRDCIPLHYPATVILRRLRTANYSDEARKRLGEAVAQARQAAGYKWRTVFATKAGISVRSLAALEQGEPTVGQATLFAVGRALPGWTEGTPQWILENNRMPVIHDSETAVPLPRSSSSDENRAEHDSVFDQVLAIMKTLSPTDALRLWADVAKAIAERDSGASDGDGIATTG